MAKHGKKLTAEKAGEILEHGEVKGHPLTAKAKRFMGWVKGGRKPRKGKRVRGAGHQGSPFEQVSTPRYSARGKLNKY